MRSVMKHDFSRVPNVSIPRSKFDRSHGHKTTFDEGYLVPVLCDEALPGDTFNVSMSAFSRMSTPIFPIMDNVYMDSFFFAVPIRLVWDNFKKFMGEQDNPADSTDYLIPTMTTTSGYLPTELSDYMGLPVQVSGIEHNSLFHRAYNLIWNEWFRDENLQDSVVVDKDDGPDDPADYQNLRRNKRHDYFTSALPWPQKGDSIDLPLGDTAPIQGTGGVTQVFSSSDATTRNLQIQTSTSDIAATGHTGATADMKFTANSANVGLEADLSSATASTINQLRQSFQIQRLLERDARGGTRYTEIVKSHFGVTSPDARLQRPEYLGGGSTPLNITPVYTVGGYNSGLAAPNGEPGAYATTAISGHGFTKSFTEHCLIIGMVSVRADLTYQQGMNRMFSRSTRYDMYWPSLSQIGEQAILNKEIYTQGTADDDNVFGYQERYAEYRYKPSIITGVMRSSPAANLDVWHLAQEFSSLPTLGSDFIEEDPPIDRILAAPSEPHFIFDSYFSMKCARPMPLYGVPGMIDHF